MVFGHTDNFGLWNLISKLLLPLWYNKGDWNFTCSPQNIQTLHFIHLVTFTEFTCSKLNCSKTLHRKSFSVQSSLKYFNTQMFGTTLFHLPLQLQHRSHMAISKPQQIKLNLSAWKHRLNMHPCEYNELKLEHLNSSQLSYKH